MSPEIKKSQTRFFKFFLNSLLIANCSLLGIPSAYSSENSGNIYFQRGVEYRNEGRFEESERQFKKALEWDPANAEFHFELASVYALQHDALKDSGAEDEEVARAMTNASRELQQSVMIKPDYLAAHYNLGVVYKKQKRFEDARKEFRRVLEIDPNQYAALMQIGATYEDQGFYDDAESIYLEAQEKNYSNPDIRNALLDLRRRREQGELNARPQLPLAGLSALRGGSLYDQTRNQSEVQNASVAQAIPYLSSWLAQQFMKSKNKQ
jgi:tetratricopeptide (TPR) repeat protein